METKRNLEATLTEYNQDRELSGPVKAMKESLMYSCYRILEQKGEVCLIPDKTNLKKIDEINEDLRMAETMGDSYWKQEHIQVLLKARQDLIGNI